MVYSLFFLKEKKKKRKLLFWQVAMPKLKTCLLVKVKRPNEWLAFERTRDNPCSHSVQALTHTHKIEEKDCFLCALQYISHFSFNQPIFWLWVTKRRKLWGPNYIQLTCDYQECRWLLFRNEVFSGQVISEYLFFFDLKSLGHYKWKFLHSCSNF